MQPRVCFMNCMLTSSCTFVSINSHEGICASVPISVLFLPMLWKQPMTPMCWSAKSFHPPPSSAFPLFSLSLVPLVSSPSSLPPSPWPQGTVSYLDAGALLWALIASVLPTASRASQHGAPAVCLICHRSVHKHSEKTGEEWNERLRKREFIKGCPSFPKPAVVSSVFCPALSLSAPCSSHSQRQSMVCSTRLLVLF